MHVIEKRIKNKIIKLNKGCAENRHTPDLLNPKRKLSGQQINHQACLYFERNDLFSYKLFFGKETLRSLLTLE